MEHNMSKQCKSVLYPWEKNVVQVRGMNGVTKATGVTVVTRDDMGDRQEWQRYRGGNGNEISTVSKTNKDPQALR